MEAKTELAERINEWLNYLACLDAPALSRWYKTLMAELDNRASIGTALGDFGD